MSEDSFGFAPPAFNGVEALVMLKRQLRDLKLAERGTRYELKGRAVVELSAQPDRIDAQLAQRAAQVPQWTTHTLKSNADARHFVEQVKRLLARWSVDE